MIEKGRPVPLGASRDGDGVNFALYSEGAESIELCFFDANDQETGRFSTDRTMREYNEDIWRLNPIELAKK